MWHTNLFLCSPESRAFDLKLHVGFTLWLNYAKNVILLQSKKVGFSIGVKVPSTSSVFVYTKVLAHNLNDYKN